LDTLQDKRTGTQKVWIFGKSNDDTSLNTLNLNDGAVLFYKNYFSKKKLYGDSLRIVLDSITSSRFLRISGFGTFGFYRGRVFISPGDTIIFEIKNKKISFHGKNAILNNFYTQLEENTSSYYSNQYKGNILAYKKVVDSIYKSKQGFFKEYLNKNKIVSESFSNAVEGDLRQSYLYELMTPRHIEANNLGLYGGEPDEFMMLINNEFGYGENFFDSKSYFIDVKLNDFKDSTLLDNSLAFKLNINQFIRYYFNSSTSEPFTKEALMAEKKFIEKNFEGKMKKYAIARMIHDYEMKGFGYSKNNIKELKAVIKEYENQFTDQSYKDEMVKINKNLDVFNFKLPDAALNITKLISLTGDTITLNDIFKRSNKRVRVINFWASWCPPCIDEIRKGKDFKDKLIVEKDVEWIYLSIDEDKEKWLKTSHQLSEFLNVRNQYLILGGKNTSLGDALKVNWIPRYVIFNTKNEIVLENAPRPSDTLMYKKIIDEISLRE